MRAGDVAQDLVTPSRGGALMSITNWQTNCSTSGVYQDEVAYVQHHTQHDSSLFSRRNPAHGGYE